MTSAQQTPPRQDHTAQNQTARDERPRSKMGPEKEAAKTPDQAVDRPGFDLGGSTGKTTAGQGVGLGEDASEDPRDRSLPGRQAGGHPAD